MLASSYSNRPIDLGWSVRVYLNQSSTPEIQTDAAFDLTYELEDLFFVGRGNRDSSWEGRIDEIVVHPKP